MVKETSTETVLKKALAEAMDYGQYRKEVLRLLETGRVTGAHQSDSYLHYTFMNEKRMDRWEKTFTPSEEVLEKAGNLKQHVIWLVITEGWCGDAAHALPVMKKLADASEFLELKLVIRDEHPELMDRFLTNGARAIPKLIMLDPETLEVLATWGARPSVAAQMVAVEKETKGVLSPEFRAEIQMWYNRDKGKTIASDLADLLSLK